MDECKPLIHGDEEADWDSSYDITSLESQVRVLANLSPPSSITSFPTLSNTLYTYVLHQLIDLHVTR